MCHLFGKPTSLCCELFELRYSDIKNFNMANVMKRPRYTKMNGLLYSEMFSPKCFQEALEYKPKPGDVFIDTYPKCGTTWMQNVAMYIFRKGKEMEKSTDFLKLAPFIDLLGMEGIINMPRPGAFKTHLPYSYMPNSPDAKYIFVARNPKDCCVSFFFTILETNQVLGIGMWIRLHEKMMSELRNLRESEDMDFTFTGLNHMYEFNKSLKPPEDLPEFEEVRKGIVGDWRNHFSVDQTERLNRKF
ncbi:sulfotransferase 1C2A [Caerostris extrusa]|uniref:Sulfotransferase 1C2A n=1 Tax=Caerostris extrusa TaxID=172846 RepID=A0AAV4UYV9_CAEEX|nr:sulfotransferase 1C2A [Caerostris extrusa]